MKMVLNTSLLVDGFKDPLPQGAVVTVINEEEARGLFPQGYASETDKKPTHDHLSNKAKAAAAAKASEETGETPEGDEGGEKPVVTTESAGAGKPAANTNKRR